MLCIQKTVIIMQFTYFVYILLIVNMINYLSGYQKCCEKKLQLLFMVYFDAQRYINSPLIVYRGKVQKQLFVLNICFISIQENNLIAKLLIGKLSSSFQYQYDNIILFQSKTYILDGIRAQIGKQVKGRQNRKCSISENNYEIRFINNNCFRVIHKLSNLSLQVYIFLRNNKAILYVKSSITQSQGKLITLNFIIINLKDMLHYLSDDDFVGTFKEKNYTILKDYIDTQKKYVRLYHTKYTPQNPHSSICIIHGFGQHSKRFSQVADFYANNGFQALLIDLRGFGFSGAPRGTATVDQMQNDVIHLLKYVRRDLPLYLYGHSMGGLIIIKLLMDRPSLNIAGCIITSPLLGFPKDRQLPWIKVVLLRLVGQKMQDFVINSMVNPTALTKNSKYIHNIFEDRLMIPFLSVKMAKSLIETIQQVNRRSAQFKCPSVFFHGKLDTITRFQDTQRFCYEYAMPYKKLYTFQQGFHQLQHDKQRDQLLKKTLQFINTLPIKPKFQNCDISLIQPKKSFPIFQYLFIGIILLLFILKRIKKISIRNWIMTILNKK